MGLSPGTRIGPYEVAAQIGVGGMGEVYRATDTNLKRSVAIKVLPSSVAGDADRLARFQREAEVLAALNHPNIAAIYGLERGDGRTALVMELVDGPTLADRIAGGALPLEEGLPIARQIAEAMEAAHEVGIVHRDLKPANIKVRADGTVKVLDFGLAKALGGDGAGSGSGPGDLTHLPTITTPAMTQVGTILGTAAYMSPEQAKGRPVDRRADLWAFGCVLFEMLTGRRAFPGEDVAETLASVIRAEPDWAALPAGVPPTLVRLLRRCLAKDVRSRLRDAGDARLELALEDEPAVVSPAPAPLGRGRWPLAVAAVASVVALALVPTTVAHLRERRVEAPAARFRIEVPAGVHPVVAGHRPILSPDGRSVVFTAQGPEGLGLFLRSVESGETRQLPGTSGPPMGFTSFWSPDSAAVAFFSDGRLWRIDVADGRRLPLFDVPENVGPSTFINGSWADDGTVLLANRGRLWRGVQGQRPVELHLVDAGDTIQFPFFLPGGQRFLYTRNALQTERTGVFVASLNGAVPALLLEGIVGGVAYADGHLLFIKDGVPIAQALDADTLILSGQATAIGDAAVGAVSASRNGRLAYLRSVTGQTQFTWFDRSGAALATVGPLGVFPTFDLSRDGRRLVVARGALGSRQNLWTIGTDDGAIAPLTTGDFRDVDPRWSRDTREVMFASSRAPGRALHRVDVGGGTPTLVMPWSAGTFSLDDWSVDGVLLYHGGGAQSLWAKAPGGEAAIIARVRSGNLDQAAVSPDGRLAAYNSDESGTFNVYVVPMTPTGERWNVTTNGGVQPVWRRDGKELFFLTPDGWLASVTVDASGGFKTGPQTRLFKTPLPATPQIEGYTVDPTGQQFLMAVPTADALAPFTVITDWLSLVSR